MILLLAMSSCEKTTSQLENDVDAIKSYLTTNGITAQEIDKVYYEVITEGTGEHCVPGDTIAIKYKMSTTESPDKIFETNDGDKAIVLYLPTMIGGTSENAPIYGFQIGVTTMKEGGVSRFYIPSSYAFGSTPMGPDSVAYANIIFEAKLCEIIHRDKKH